MPPPGISPELFERLDQVADAINPALTLWALLVLWSHARRAREHEPFPLGRTLGAWIGAIVLVFVIAHLNRWLNLWPDYKYFPSGHIAYACCVATLGATLQRRSIALTTPLILLYSLLIVRLGYHAWLDIAGALVLAPPLTLLALRKLAPSRSAPTL